ncbi:MAG: hypothetical protein A3C71_00305 [Candidatus Yanofskybacteria bacterium RIFCSPHIGHO2_02_FULL_43_15c]|uniref:Uncharacterized protein n=1 Tax=Candidatus Yanofskybacteria bacterium RIFCSPHIGHO2_02_FULL_43_15c TaxID=1802679 RepID=A0A1F8FDD3_9BACT|nr:MAG: hypothetical protein A3C71_00305 [Candidatus Yanofskybacteria bacterium RIFCSPHIGHO2_02_FULL_43_15c]
MVIQHFNTKKPRFKGLVFYYLFFIPEYNFLSDICKELKYRPLAVSVVFTFIYTVSYADKIRPKPRYQ